MAWWRSTSRTWYWVIVLGIAAIVLGVACTGGDDDGPASTSSGTTSASPQAGTQEPRSEATLSAADRLALDQGIGREATDDDITPIDIDVKPDGEGLPDGSGSAMEGAEIYAARCAACHGDTGRNPTIGPQLVTDPGPWQPGEPKTVGSYWPYATTVYSYIQRAMPLNEPGSLTADEVYAVVAWLLNQHEIIPDDAEMNRDTLPAVEMPNRDNFTPCWPDPCRPDVE